jgi:hydrogenase large subunit
MRRVTVGPFNRVEGDLEVRLDVEDGVVRRAEVTAPLYRGFEQILVGRPALDALAIVPRICGICSVSQSIAAAAALRDALGVTPAPNGLLSANIAHAAENVADHLTHFYLFFMPDFARDAYTAKPWHPAVAARFAATRGEVLRQFLPVRTRLLEVMGVVAGKWPHSLAFQPGGTTRAIDVGDRVHLLSIVSQLRAFLENVVFGGPIDEVLALGDPLALANWCEGRRGDFATFLVLADDLALERLGPGPRTLMSFGAYAGDPAPLFASGVAEADATPRPLAIDEIAEDVAHAWMREGTGHPARTLTVPDANKEGAYSWAKAPRLGGKPAEVGALARQVIARQPLVCALAARSGANVANRVVARLIESVRLVNAMQSWIGALRLNDPFCINAPVRREGRGAGLVEAARGSLGHWIELSNGAITHYQIIAPTTWNFSPRDASGIAGPLEQALEGTRVGDDGARSVAVQHVVRSFDPCMVCTAH